MANMDKYDPRLDSLVVERRTLWDAEIGELDEKDRRWLAEAVQQQPQHAARIHYERTHTGFIREITVTLADIERLYQQRLAGQQP